MKTNWKAALDHVLAWEGGFVDHPRDPGGATNRGITLATYARWRGVPTSREDLRAITHDEVATIYATLYWNTVRGNDLPAGIDLATFDWAVLTGPRRARVHLQNALAVVPDGIIGPITLAAAHREHPIIVLADFTIHRQDFLDGLAIYGTFGRGWSRRLVDTYWKGRQLATRTE